MSFTKNKILCYLGRKDQTFWSHVCIIIELEVRSFYFHKENLSFQSTARLQNIRNSMKYSLTTGGL